MNTTTETIHHPIRETSLKWIAGGSMMEAIAAIATIALAIVGLAAVWPTTMAAIATIVIGAGLLTEGGAFGVSTMSSGSAVESSVTNTGTSAGFFGGVAGIVLGILALLNIAAPTLLAVALIVFGATFLVSSLGMGELWSNGGQLMGGLAGIVLGIVAVCGNSGFTLVLVGLLCLGAAGLFAGSALGLRSAGAARTV